MVRLNRIYTRTGDDGSSGLATGERRFKDDLRFEAIGGVDETNAAIGIARLHIADYPDLDLMLGSIQNDLFDLGADLATPEAATPPAFEPLRILPVQVERLEKEIERGHVAESAAASACCARAFRASTPCLGAKTKARRKISVCSTTMMPPVAPSRK